jgi:cell division GTPase FtsZ
MRPLAVGLGRGGGRILDWFLERVWDDVAPETLAVDVNPDHLAEVHAKETLLLGENSLDKDELLTPRLAGTLVYDEFNRLESYLTDHSPLWVVTGLGGVFGNTAAPILARQNRDRRTFGVVSQPFEFEPDGRLDRADRGQRRLELYCDEVFSLRLELILNYIARDEVRPSQLFKLANQVMGNLLYFLMKPVLDGSQADEEAVDRLRNVSSQQKQNILLNSLAPGWGSPGRREESPKERAVLSEASSPEEEASYLKQLQKRIRDEG